MIDSGLSVRKAARSSDTTRRAIPAHPMGIVQQRPRGDLWTPADWYAAEWWRIRLSRMIRQAFDEAKQREEDAYFAGFKGRRRAGRGTA